MGDAMMDKTKYKKEVQKNKKRKLFKVLLILMIVSFILGVLFVAILSKDDRTLIKSSMDAFFSSIQSNSYSQNEAFFNNVLSNVVLSFLVWLLGISMIGIPISVFYLTFKSFVFGFSLSSMIYTYGVMGILPSIIYSFPLLVNLAIIFLLTFYAVNFSKKLYWYLFKKKEIDLKSTVRVYSKFLGVLFAVLFISSIFSGYLVPILLKSFTNKLI